MGIKQVTPQSEIDNFIESKIKQMRDVILHNLKYVAEEVLNTARTNGNYEDQTGNLRHSVGYIIVENGATVLASADVEIKSGVGANGVKMGKKYAEQLAQKYTKGIVLIVYAGMNYASYVSAKGYDVLDSAELTAEKLVPQMLKQLGFKV